MQRLRLLLVLLLPAALLACAAPNPGRPGDPEVVVYGGTSGGIACAVQLARHGRSVVLLEPTHRVGGLSTSGLGATDIGNKAAVGGVSREFYRRLRTHYANEGSWVREAAADFKGRGHRPNEDAAWTFEPKVALQIFEEMLAEAEVPVVHGARLDLGPGGVTVEDGRIVSIRTVDGQTYRARCFVDATYEGDLLAKAGVSYRVGREANAEHGETLDGVQVQNATKHQFTHDVDPYVVPGDPTSGLLRYVSADGPGEEGAADHRVQAYCFRLCTTDVPDNRLPWPKPAGYDERDFELLLRNFDAGDRRVPWHPVLMPNRKTDTNNNFAISTDAIGLSYGWPEADWDERARIFAEHLYYTQGLLWTLANHPRVPAEVQREFHKWGLPKDEFVETGNWPPQLYVREARRMVSDVVLAEKHCRGLEVVDDPVGLGAYGMDSHNVQRYVDAEGRVRNEGDVQVHGFTPYGISYRSIVPTRGECTNLLVPVCLSSTHIAFGSARMEPVFMVLGHSAATAAHLALGGNGVVQDVRYDELREELLASDQTLAWVGEKKALPTGLDPAKLAGHVVDERDARFTGSWQQSDSIRPFVGAGYSHDGEAAPGTTKATFEIFVTEPGRYSAQIAWQPHPNRALGRATAHHRGSESSIDVDQRKAPPIDGLWLEVGVLTVSVEEPVTIELERVGTEGFLVIDAARLVRVGGE